MKKTALILCLLLIASLFSSCAGGKDPSETGPDAGSSQPPDTDIDIVPSLDARIKFALYEDHVEVIGWEYVVGRVEIPASHNGKPVTKIAARAFEGCSLLEGIILHEGLSEIGDSAFLGCVSLTSAEIPDTVKSIGEYAFYGCCALESISVGSGVSAIGANAFANCVSLGGIAVSASNGFYKSLEGVLFNHAGDTLICYPSGRGGESYAVPGGVESLANYSFAYAQKLSTLTMTNSVSSMGDNTFDSCYALESVTLSSSLTYIGASSFYRCTALESIVIPEGVKSIGYVSEGFEHGGSFADCHSLKSISFPASLSRICGRSFDGCRSVSNIRFEGSEAGWRKVDIGDDNTYLSLAAMEYGK